MTVTESAIRIRLATPADAALLARIGAELYAQTYAAQNTVDDLRAYLAHAFGEPQQRRELLDPDMRTWIADADGEIAGYVQLRLNAPAANLTLEKPAELARIYVDRRWHGGGLGALLLGQCVDAAGAWGATHLWLGVWKENPRGIAFYTKHGFRVAGEQTFQVGTDTQHDWTMLRDLGSTATADR